MKSRQRRIGPVALGGVTLMSGAWLTLLATAPILPASIALFAYAVGSAICHQIAERSFHVAGAQLAVCARCTGIYAGATVAFCWQWLRSADGPSLAAAASAGSGERISPVRLWLVAGAVPTIATVILEQADVWHTSNLVRALAGFPLGAAVAVVVGRAATLHYDEWRPRRLV